MQTKIQPLKRRGFCDGLNPSTERYSPSPSRCFSLRYCEPIRRSRRRNVADNKDPSGRCYRTKFRQGSKQRHRSSCSNRVGECKNLLDRFVCRKWRTIAMAVLFKRGNQNLKCVLLNINEINSSHTVRIGRLHASSLWIDERHMFTELGALLASIIGWSNASFPGAKLIVVANRYFDTGAFAAMQHVTWLRIIAVPFTDDRTC